MRTVLVVDDNELARTVTARVLSRSNFEVREAQSGTEGMEMVQDQLPDLVVLDIVMPGMNGYAFCRWLKSTPKGQHIPVIMCSAKSEAFDRYWGMKQGVDAYITKPFEPMELVETVRCVLRQSLLKEMERRVPHKP
ncbi:PleD family two-component system response regulator [Leptolyngbya sp. FACHB-261]|uniref:response regulator n=1 Tax=Leptolyngbya sp. FACHB-261 TaxID=2692806 RepID=UPI0016831F73|nr:response regulator [Leptolyngbya sp. FACHB-261]MBD2104943.1 response regulator [Leptolyngbya sp. FACHB-261]